VLLKIKMFGFPSRTGTSYEARPISATEAQDLRKKYLEKQAKDHEQLVKTRSAEISQTACGQAFISSVNGQFASGSNHFVSVLVPECISQEIDGKFSYHVFSSTLYPNFNINVYGDEVEISLKKDSVK